MTNCHSIGGGEGGGHHATEGKNTTQHNTARQQTSFITTYNSTKVTINKSTTLVYVYIFDSVHDTWFDGACSIGQLLFHGYARLEGRERTGKHLGLNPRSEH